MLSDRIKELTELNNMTLKELAKTTGIPYSSLQKYASGEQTPGAEVFIKLASNLPVDLNHLLLGPSYDREDPIEQQGDIDIGLFKEIVGAIRSESSEVKNERLDDLLDELVSIYNSARKCPDIATRAFLFESQIKLLNTTIVKQRIDFAAAATNNSELSKGTREIAAGMEESQRSTLSAIEETKTDD